MVHIDRCVCYDVTFARLKAVADATGADSVEALQAQVPFGLRCQVCHPYARRMLETGEVVFHELLPTDKPS